MSKIWQVSCFWAGIIFRGLLAWVKVVKVLWTNNPVYDPNLYQWVLVKIPPPPGQEHFAACAAKNRHREGEKLPLCWGGGGEKWYLQIYLWGDTIAGDFGQGNLLEFFESPCLRTFINRFFGDFWGRKEWFKIDLNMVQIFCFILFYQFEKKLIKYFKN